MKRSICSAEAEVYPFNKSLDVGRHFTPVSDKWVLSAREGDEGKYSIGNIYVVSRGECKGED